MPGCSLLQASVAPARLLRDKIKYPIDVDTFKRERLGFRKTTGHVGMVCGSFSHCTFCISCLSFKGVCGLFLQKRRRRIDRSMIGEPTNFVHTTHVGSGDMGLGLASVSSHLCPHKSTANTCALTFTLWHH